MTSVGVSVSLFASESFASTMTVTAVSSLVTALSACATGAVFAAGVMVIVTVAVFDCAEPSLTRYVKVSVPL